MSGRAPILIPINAVINNQMAGKHLAINTLPFKPGASNGFKTVDTGVVHNIDRYIEHLGNPNSTIGGFTLHLGRARQWMPFWTPNSLLKNLLLQAIYQFSVFGMNGGHGAELAAAQEAIYQDLVVAHDGALVGHKMLEAVDPIVTTQGAHVVADRVVPPGDCHVERIVACGLLGPAVPGVPRFHQRLLRIRNNEVNDHGRAAGKACRSSRKEIF